MINADWTLLDRKWLRLFWRYIRTVGLIGIVIATTLAVIIVLSFLYPVLGVAVAIVCWLTVLGLMAYDDRKKLDQVVRRERAVGLRERFGKL